MSIRPSQSTKNQHYHSQNQRSVSQEGNNVGYTPIIKEESLQHTQENSLGKILSQEGLPSKPNPHREPKFRERSLILMRCPRLFSYV